jgi:biotin carboxylase
MRRVVLLIPSSTYRATDFVAAAGALDLDLVVASDRRSALQAVIGDRSQVVDLDRPQDAADKLVALHDRLPFDAVVGVDDQGVLAASAVAERLGLPHSSVAAVATTRDKHLLRERLSAAGLAQPLFALTTDDAGVEAAVESVGLPCVLKPLHLSASRGVIRADSVPEALAAARRVRDIAGSSELLVESYVEGIEVAVEVLVSAGNIHVLAIFDKPDPLEGPYFEETIYVTPSRLGPEVQQRVRTELERAIRALELNEGPVHAEFRIGETGVVALEIAARSIGGLCSRALRFGAGVSLEELILRHALGLGIGERRLEDGASGVMMIPIPARGTLVRVGNVDQARAVPGIEGLEITIPVGQKVEPLPEGDRYLGFLFAAASDPADVESSLRQALALLDIAIKADENRPKGTNRRGDGGKVG